MILYYLLKIVYWIIYAFMWVFLQLPDVSLPDHFKNSLLAGYSYAQAINTILPIYELVTSICVVFLAYEGYYLLLKIINWIIRKIPSIN